MTRSAWGLLALLGGCSTFSPIAEAPQCLRDTDCANGRVCRDEVCIVQCRLDTECADGERCVFSQCQPAPASPLDQGVIADMQGADMLPTDMSASVDMQVPDAAVDMSAPDATPDMAPMDAAPAVDMAAVDAALVVDMAPDAAPVADMAAAAPDAAE